MTSDRRVVVNAQVVALGCVALLLAGAVQIEIVGRLACAADVVSADGAVRLLAFPAVFGPIVGC